VAADPALRRAPSNWRTSSASPAGAAARMAVRAQALVGFAAERPARRRGWPACCRTSAAASLPARRLAGMAVIVAAVGFLLGGGLGESYVEGKYASLQSPTDTRPLAATRSTI
jgi:hypothetical protein